MLNDAGIVRYLKDLCLLLIWVSALIIVVVTTARQIPAEIESRTIYPLLAKPVTRAQVILGKFLGCWLASGIALVVFYLFFAVVTGLREHQWHLAAYLQAFWLQWAFLAIVTALVMLGSMTFTTSSVNSTVSLIVVAGLLFIGGHLGKLALRQAEPIRSIGYTIYFIIPHLEFYDIRDQVVNNRPLPGGLNCFLASLYAAGYSAAFLLLAWLGFRRKALNK